MPEITQALRASQTASADAGEGRVTPTRDHYYSVDVFIPSGVQVSEDRTRWYLDHAIRGYQRTFASDTDPIRGMRRCSVGVKKVFFRDLAALRQTSSEPVAWRFRPSKEAAAPFPQGEAWNYGAEPIRGASPGFYEVEPLYAAPAAEHAASERVRVLEEALSDAVAALASIAGLAKSNLDAGVTALNPQRQEKDV